jgi:cysteinyl-tRNA synthetase
MWELLRDKKAKGKIETVRKMDEILALNLLFKEHIKIPSNIQKLINEREDARKNKNFKLSDELREKINNLGYQIDDTNNGTIVRKN